MSNLIIPHGFSMHKISFRAILGCFSLISVWLLSSSVAFAAVELDLSNRIKNSLQSQSETVLSNKQAFSPTISVRDDELIAAFSVAEGYYLYRDKIELFLEGVSDTLGTIVIPPGTEKEDPIFGSTEILQGDFSISRKIKGNQYPADVIAVLKYQGCKDKSICYPPEVLRQAFDLSAFSINASSAPPTESLFSQQRLTHLLEAGNYFWIVLGFFVVGLFLAFTPCVFPMLPILSGVVLSGDPKKLGFKKSLFLASVYVLAMALGLAMLGLIAGSLSFNLQAYMQKPSIILTTTLFLFVLGAAMFGCFAMPGTNQLQNRLSALVAIVPGGKVVSTLLIGFFSTLIVSPCVTPALIAALLFIAHSNNALLGATALFFMGLGMGAPLVAFSVAAGSWLPKAGAWMIAVKQFIALAIFSMGIWLVDRLQWQQITYALLGWVLILCALYIRSLYQTALQTRPLRLFLQSIVLSLFVYGIGYLLVSVFSIQQHVLLPVSPQLEATNIRNNYHDLPFESVISVEQLFAKFSQAKSERRKVFVDFYADWCVACKEIERDVFSQSQVRAALRSYLLLRIDVTAYNKQDREIMKKFEIPGPPVLLIFDPQHSYAPLEQFVGVPDIDQLLDAL